MNIKIKDLIYQQEPQCLRNSDNKLTEIKQQWNTIQVLPFRLRLRLVLFEVVAVAFTLEADRLLVVFRGDLRQQLGTIATLCL